MMGWRVNQYILHVMYLLITKYLFISYEYVMLCLQIL